MTRSGVLWSGLRGEDRGQEPARTDSCQELSVQARLQTGSPAPAKLWDDGGPS